MKKLFLLLCCALYALGLQAQQQPDSALLTELLASRPDLFGKITAPGSPYKVQIVFTQIDRDRKNRPSFRTHTYRLDTSEYFYPASTVKLPLSVLALEKLNGIPGLDKDTPLSIDSADRKQIAVQVDSSAANGKPSIGHYIKKVLLVSDNDAYNRLYEFLGQQPSNEGLWSRDMRDTYILHRFSVGDDTASAKCTNPMTFYDLKSGKSIYQQPSVYNTEDLCARFTEPLTIGHAHLDGRDSLVQQPLDFRFRNRFPLKDQHQLLKAIFFPESLPEAQRFGLKEQDYRFLYQYMSMLPSETTYPDYRDSTHYWDSYVKFFMFGDKKDPMPKHIRIFNKVGTAYGFLLDNAYIVDFEKKVEFMLTAVISCDADGVLNDGKYDYDEVGFPFLGNLGRLLYEQECQRPRKHLPDLRRFYVDYQRQM